MPSITASYTGSANFNSSVTSSSMGQQVRYTINVLSTSGLTIVLQLLDDTKANVSASNLTVTAQCVVAYTSPAPTTCGASPIQAISNGTFSFNKNWQNMGPAYQYRLSGKGLSKGNQYFLLVQADGDPIWHAIPFTD